MIIIYYLLPLALILGGGFLFGFVISARSGQYDDLETPAHRILLDDEDQQISQHLNERTRT